ncbi:hypothetical protein JW824_13525 [bacterium]|nr:hypothetical protein [bacterium]
MHTKPNIKKFLHVMFALILFSSMLCCDKKNPSEAEEQDQDSSLCFTVDGFDITVHNLWSYGGSYTVNCQGIVSFKVVTSVGNESHTLEWTNISNNYNTFTVDSFNVKIDGKDYSYPKDKCK